MPLQPHKLSVNTSMFVCVCVCSLCFWRQNGSFCRSVRVCMCAYMHVCMDGCMHGWMDECTDTCVDV
jgi:hypothetical protein